MAADVIQNVPWLHIRFEGRSYDLPLADLDLGGYLLTKMCAQPWRDTWAYPTRRSSITLSNGMPTVT